MLTKHQSPVIVVAGLFVIFLVIIPIAKDIYYYNHPEPSEKSDVKNCCLGNKLQGVSAKKCNGGV